MAVELNSPEPAGVDPPTEELEPLTVDRAPVEAAVALGTCRVDEEDAADDGEAPARERSGPNSRLALPAGEIVAADLAAG